MAPTQKADPQGTTPQQTDPRWPDMTKQEMLAEIERVSGPATPLQSVRDALPTARCAPPVRSMRVDPFTRGDAGRRNSRRTAVWVHR